jgi:hypothetical protein
MLLNMATLTQRFAIGDFGYAVFGKPNLMMCFPSVTEWVATSLTPPISTDVEMTFLRT